MKKGRIVPQTNKKFRTLNVGGGVTILVPLSNFSTEKVLFCTHFTNWFKSFLCFWRVFFWLNFRIGLENCTWSVNSDIIQLIFFRGEGVFVFFYFYFYIPCRKKVRKSSFLVSLISMIQNRLRKFELVYSWDFNRTIFQAMFPYFPINPRNLDSKYIIKIQKKSSPYTLVK